MATNTVPVGTIIDFAGISPPSGYLALPMTQTNISRTTYAALYAAIGETWGIGDGATTFGLPWFPAYYAAVQSNANVGSRSAGEVISHSHTFPQSNSGNFPSGSQVGTTNDTLSGTYTTAASGGTANLAAGVRILKCIKI